MFLVDWIASKAVGGIVWLLAYILGAIAGIVLTLGGVLLDFALKINLALLDNPFIKTGWNIVLNFTNLGFVLAIIVIAFATILGLQSYGIKKTLWKLIVAALLVNFSLAIGGFFIEISDSVTVFFNSKIQGASGSGLATKMTSILNPQFMLSGGDFRKMLQQKEGGPQIASSSQAANGSKTTNSSSSAAGFGSGGATAGLGEAGSALDLQLLYQDPPSFNSLNTIIKGIATLAFIALFTILAAITLLGVAVTLIVRYIYLTFLLILSPIIWLAWIFPSTVTWWKWWWKKLLHWLIFAPMVLFFLYLTIYVIQMYPDTFSQYAQKSLGNQSFSIDIAYISSLVMILGLLMGGLILSNKLGVVGSKTIFGWGESMMRGIGDYAKTKGKQFGTAPLRAKIGEKTVGQHISNYAAKHPVAARLGLGYLGRGASRLESVGGKNLVSVAAGKIKGLSTNEKIAMLSYADAPTRIAILKDLTKSRDLHKIPAGKYLSQKYKDEFNRFDEGTAYGNIQKGIGFNITVVSASNRQERNEAAAQFYQGLDKGDRKKIKFDELFRKRNYGFDEERYVDLRQSSVYGMLVNDPGYIRTVFSNGDMSPRELNIFKEDVKEVLDQLLSTENKTPEQIKEDKIKAEEINKTLTATLASARLGLTEASEGVVVEEGGPAAGQGGQGAGQGGAGVQPQP